MTDEHFPKSVQPFSPRPPRVAPVGDPGGNPSRCFSTPAAPLHSSPLSALAPGKAWLAGRRRGFSPVARLGRLRLGSEYTTRWWMRGLQIEWSRHRNVQAGSIWIWRLDDVGRRRVVVFAAGFVGSLDPAPGDLRRLFFLILLLGGLSPMALASLLVSVRGSLPDPE